MDQLEALKKLQKIELEVLLCVSSVCSTLDINWFMDSGTALGAVRHQGFIPWDDDIDIGMLRDDYSRFLNEAPKLLAERGCSLHTSNNTAGFAPMFAKVFKDGTRFETQETREAGLSQGVFVDIFPYDYLYKDSKARKKQIRTARNAQYLSYLYHAKSISVPHAGPIGLLEHLACCLVHRASRFLINDTSVYQDTYDSCALAKGQDGASEYCTDLHGSYMKPIAVTYLVPTQMASFEGYELPVPGKVEDYLCNLYDDWRKIPAPEDRHTHLPLLIDFGDGDIWEAR